MVVDSFFPPPLLFSPRSVIYLFHSMSPEVPRPFITNSNSDSALLRGPKRRIYIYIYIYVYSWIKYDVLGYVSFFAGESLVFHGATWMISNEIRLTEYFLFFFLG